MYNPNTEVVGHLIPLGRLTPPQFVQDPPSIPTLVSVLNALIQPVEDMDVVIDTLHARLEQLDAVRPQDDLDRHTLRSEREELLKEMALASIILVQLRALQQTSVEMMS